METVEDQVICVELAERLERDFGIRFAPVEVARHFSSEHMTLPLHADDPAGISKAAFGFHGFFNFHLVFGDDELLSLIDRVGPAERRRLLLTWEAKALLANLGSAGREHAVRELTSRIAAAADGEPA